LTSAGPRMLAGEFRNMSGLRLVACHSNHAVLVTKSGDTYSWGIAAHGRLGIGAPTPRPVGRSDGVVDTDDGPLFSQPRLVPALCGLRVTQISCGATHTVALVDSGDVFTWGGGLYGQLGLCETVDVFEPVLLRALCGSGSELLPAGHANQHSAGAVSREARAAAFERLPKMPMRFVTGAYIPDWHNPLPNTHP
jgi:hypothetical protein